MNDGFSGVAGVAFVKAYGLKAAFGMLGAAILYAVLPPLKKDGTFDRREFVIRLACAGIFSMFFGEWAVQLLSATWPWLQAEKHTAAVELIVGAPGWWVSRAGAIWLQRRSNKDLGEVVEEVK
jgi:hypothetical protein